MTVFTAAWYPDVSLAVKVTLYDFSLTRSAVGLYEAFPVEALKVTGTMPLSTVITTELWLTADEGEITADIRGLRSEITAPLAGVIDVILGVRRRLS